MTKNYNITINATARSSLTADELEKKLVIALFDTDTQMSKLDGVDEELEVGDYTKTEAVEICPECKENLRFIIKTVFLVRQTQPEAGFDRHAFAAFDSYSEATKCRDWHNKKYGYGAEIDSNGDVQDVPDEENCHYYKVEELEIKSNFKPFSK